MSRELLTRETMPIYLDRLKGLRADAKPLWGMMGPNKMVAHLTQSFRISLNEVPVEDRSNWFLRWLGPFIATDLMRMPKNVKSPAVFQPTSVNDLGLELPLFGSTMERFLISADEAPERTGTSPLFGPVPLKTWRRLHAVHIDHHLRQFGL